MLPFLEILCNTEFQFEVIINNDAMNFIVCVLETCTALRYIFRSGFGGHYMQSISLVLVENSRKLFSMFYAFILVLGAVYDNSLGLTFLLVLDSTSLFLFFTIWVSIAVAFLLLICILLITNEHLFMSYWPLGCGFVRFLFQFLAYFYYIV